MAEEEYEEWSVWRDYSKGKIGIEKEGRETVLLTPEQARDAVDEVEEAIKESDSKMDSETRKFHRKMLEYADELEQKNE